MLCTQLTISDLLIVRNTLLSLWCQCFSFSFQHIMCCSSYVFVIIYWGQTTLGSFILVIDLHYFGSLTIEQKDLSIQHFGRLGLGLIEIKSIHKTITVYIIQNNKWIRILCAAVSLNGQELFGLVFESFGELFPLLRSTNFSNWSLKQSERLKVCTALR